MLTIRILESELYDEETNTFYTSKPTTVRLEHSLISISKWEFIWEKPFLPSNNDDDKTHQELKSYVECMIVGDVQDYVLDILWLSHLKQIKEYISKGGTATKVYTTKKITGRRQTVTSELLYYWMIFFDIPFECQRWHLNRLLALIEVCRVKQQKDNKMSRHEIYERNRALNQSRRAAAKSKR